MTNARFYSLSLILGTMALLFGSGCMTPQLAMPYKPAPATLGAGSQVQVSVTDARELIVNGTRQPSYVGGTRGSYGRKQAIATKGKVPLAQKLSTDLQAELKALGYSLGDSGKKLEVVIKTFDADGAVATRIWYELEVKVLSSTGQELANEKVEGNVSGGVSVMRGAYYALMKNMPVVYGDMVKAIVRNNEPIKQALK